jgi:hypothetical protein
MRIVSLLPSATETICALGLEDQLVGVTHECDYPPFVRDLPKVTETLIPTDASSAEIDGLVRERLDDGRALYALDLPVLESLRPDLIVTQALCDVCAVAEAEVKAAACTLPVPRASSIWSRRAWVTSSPRCGRWPRRRAWPRSLRGSFAPSRHAWRRWWGGRPRSW